MPAKSKAQNRLMEAAAHTPGGFGGVPQKVGKEFADADKGKSLKKLPETVNSTGKTTKSSKKGGETGEMMKNGFTKGGFAG